jgi:carbon storage regulator
MYHEKELGAFERRRFKMLVLSRRDGEEIQIGNNVTVLVVKIGRGKVRLGIAAPAEIPIHRAEVADQMLNEQSLKPFKEVIHDRLF